MEMIVTEEQLNALGERITRRLIAGDLRAAAQDGLTFAALRWGMPESVHELNGQILSPACGVVSTLTIPKLKHDIEQIRYLQQHGILGNEYSAFIGEYERVIERLTKSNRRERMSLTEDEAQRIGHIYGRLIHVRDTPRVRKALSDHWDPTQVEEQYLMKPLSAVTIDNFLAEDALQGIRLFCLESTIWSTIRYAHGRLGAFFRDGFNCPLLFQIAQELRKVFPRVVGPYPLRQLWAFKYASSHPGDSVHADFAAVNVNFWTTPDEANLDPSTGGLLMFDVEAPVDWKFASYNRDAAAIKAFLQEKRPRAVRIPYRSNRAIIFTSDLFHTTDIVEFRPGYENRRINITLLYGDRENSHIARTFHQR
jgi:hypothetical protein